MSNSLGVITINNDHYENSDHKIRFLNADGSLWYEMDCYSGSNYPKGMNIIAFEPDYFLLYIKCVAETEKGYKVEIDPGNIYKFIKPSDKIELITWEKYILRSIGVVFDKSSNPLLDKPNGKVREVEVVNDEYEAVKIKNEWLQLRWNISDDPDNHPEFDYGWIKWKEGDDLVIDLYHLL